MSDAFKPLGNTVAITAASSAPTGVQAGTSPAGRSAFAGQYRVINAGNPAAGIPLVPGAVEILSFEADAYFSGLASTNTTIYITPGAGL